MNGGPSSIVKEEQISRLAESKPEYHKWRVSQWYHAPAVRADGCETVTEDDERARSQYDCDKTRD